MECAIEQRPTVFIVDDDPLVGRFLQAILSQARVTACSLESAAEFLRIYEPSRPGCLLLDVQMPGMSGPELQNRLNTTGARIPIIFISAHANVPVAVEAMLHGAFDFLQKPVNHEVLLQRVSRALEFDAECRAANRERDAMMERFNSLTTRERDILYLLISGQSNKAMAADLRLSQRTIEFYRARVMEKTRSRSLAELIRMAIDMNVTSGARLASTRH